MVRLILVGLCIAGLAGCDSSKDQPQNKDSNSASSPDSQTGAAIRAGDTGPANDPTTSKRISQSAPQDQENSIAKADDGTQQIQQKPPAANADFEQQRKPTTASKDVSNGKVPQANQPVLCEKLESKRAPTGLVPQAIVFDGPRGNGHDGANGFLIDAPEGWEGTGTVWSCDFSSDSTVKATPHPVSVSSDLPAAKVKVTNQKPVALTKENGWNGIPEYLQGASIYSESVNPDKSDNSVEFTVEQDGVVVVVASWTYDGNPSGGWFEGRSTMESLQREGWVALETPDLQTGKSTFTIFRRAVKAGEKFRFHTRKYNPPFVIALNDEQARLALAQKAAVVATEGGASSNRGVIFIHPLLEGHIVVTVTSRRVHVGSPKQWPTPHTYDPRYPFMGEFRPRAVPTPGEFFPLGTGSHHLTSSLAADGTYEFLIDGKVAYAGDVIQVFPVELTSELKGKQGELIARLAEGTGGVLVGPADGGIARASQIQFEVAESANSVAKKSATDLNKNGDDGQPPTGRETDPLWQHEVKRLTSWQKFDWQKGFVYGIDVSRDGRQVLAASTAGFARLLDAKTGLKLRDFLGHTDGVSSVAFSPDGSRALTGSWDKTMRMWDVETGKELRKFVDHEWPVLTVAFSPDGKRALSASDGLRLWEIETGNVLHRFPKLHPNNPIWSAKFTPDGRRALGGSGNGSFALWDLETDKPPEILDAEAGRLKCVDVSRDGRFAIAVAADRPLVRLYDLETGKQVRQFEGHRNGVASGVFSPDGKNILTGAGQLSPQSRDFDTSAADRSVRLWNVSTGRELLRIDDHKLYVTSVVFSPDGDRAFSGSGDGIVRVWDLESLAAKSSQD